MKLFKSNKVKEKNIDEIKFHKYKFNNRVKPDKNKTLIITCFTEFGCESIGITHCIPRVKEEYTGYYVIAVGWYGREYLYRHLVDEFWEIYEEFQYLREHSESFGHDSKNLEILEDSLGEFGRVYRSSCMGNICLGNTCKDCKYFWEASFSDRFCPKCKSKNLIKGLLNDVKFYKKLATPIPRPNISRAKSYLKSNSVGIFARNRIRHDRNLSSGFYIKLITQLESMGYNPIWLGEKQSVLPCPVSHILDFSRLPESRDLELTLAIISELEFTLQFWTASTRLASIMNVPWILVETPAQISVGHEGRRLALTTNFDKKKLIISHFHAFKDNEDKGLELIKQAIQEIQENNWNNIFGLIENPELINFKIKELW